MNVLRDFSFFWKKESFCVFFSSWAENCHTLAMNLQPIVKNAFFLSRGTFSRRLFLFWKKINSLVFPLKKWAQPSKKFITMNFWQKISARLSQLDSTPPEGLFADFFNGKESIAKTFSQLERSSLCFVETFRQVCETCITASGWICWGKMCFLLKNIGLQFFFRCEEKCPILAKKIQQHRHFWDFICLANLFQRGPFFLEKKTNNLLIFSKFRGIFF